MTQDVVAPTPAGDCLVRSLTHLNECATNRRHSWAVAMVSLPLYCRSAPALTDGRMTKLLRSDASVSPCRSRPNESHRRAVQERVCRRRTRRHTTCEALPKCALNTLSTSDSNRRARAGGDDEIVSSRTRSESGPRRSFRRKSDARQGASTLVDRAGEDFRRCALETVSTDASNADVPTDDPQLCNGSKQLSPEHLWNAPTQYDFAHGKKFLKTLNFDALSYSAETLVDLCVEIFLEMDVDKDLGISPASLRAFVQCVRGRMLDNPYHNWFHVVDVAQTSYCLSLQSGLMAAMTGIERLALVVAALCHDLEHPGVNSVCLVRAKSALATLYDMDPACLERHHSFRATELMTSSKHGLLDVFSPEEEMELILQVEDLILATDMGRHGEYLTALRAAVAANAAANASAGGGAEEGLAAAAAAPRRRLLAELIIKCADASNVVKPFPVAKRWAVRITDEFFLQGDWERRRGLSVTPACDRAAQSRVALQRLFIDGVIGPFYAAVADLLPRLAPVAARLRHTRAMWDRFPSDDALLLPAAAPAPPAPAPAALAPAGAAAAAGSRGEEAARAQTARRKDGSPKGGRRRGSGGCAAT